MLCVVSATALAHCLFTQTGLHMLPRQTQLDQEQPTSEPWFNLTKQAELVIYKIIG